MNILYIANPKSIHDKKWMSFFSEKKGFNIYVVGESLNRSDYASTKKELEELNIIQLPMIAPFRFTTPLSSLNSVKQLNKTIKDLKIDIIHILFSAPHALWALFVNKPIVLSNRGSDVLKVLPALQSGNLKDKFFFSLFKAAFRKCTITSTSWKQNQKVAEMFGLKETTVIRTGVEVERIKNLGRLDNQERKLIFSPRYFSPVYNVELIFKAIELLPKELLDICHFVFIKGTNYKTPYANNLTEKLSSIAKYNGASVQIIDQLSQTEIWQMYSKASLTVMTPLSDGTPNTALEAMSAKCPLIVPKLDYDKELFDNTCFILEERNPKELAGLIQKAIQNYPYTLLNNGYESVLRHGNRQVEMCKLEKIYNRIITETN